MAHPMNDQRGGFPVTGAVTRRSLRPQDARRHHRALVLSLLQRSPGSSRAQLARSTGLSQVAISGVVAELIAEGIVAEQGIRPSTRPGAPARALHLISAARTVAAVAISSADEIEGTLFDLTGTQLFHTTVSRAGAVGPDALALLEGVIETVLEQAEAPFSASASAPPASSTQTASCARRRISLGAICRFASTSSSGCACPLPSSAASPQSASQR